MSEVAIRDIFYHISNADINKVQDIEVIPRKIVEMIIAECNSQMSDFHHNPSIVNTARHIKDYAESLLEQFEGDGE